MHLVVLVFVVVLGFGLCWFFVCLLLFGVVLLVLFVSFGSVHPIAFSSVEWIVVDRHGFIARSAWRKKKDLCHQIR